MSSRFRDVVERTHPHLLTPTGERLTNDRYEDFSTFVGLSADVDPLEASTDRRTRRSDTLTDLLLGACEAAANAQLHGHAPPGSPSGVRRTGSSSTSASVVTAPRTVSPDSSATPTNATSELGLWLTHQLDVDVDLVVADDGFTVRFRATRTPWC